MSWRIPRKTIVLKTLAAVVLGLLCLVSLGNALRLLIAGIGMAGFAVSALRDVMAPIRLSADPAGVTVVVGFARLRKIPWGDIERIRVDEHQRLGRVTRLVEIDTGETLHLFSAAELGVPADDVVRALRGMTHAGDQADSGSEA